MPTGNGASAPIYLNRNELALFTVGGSGLLIAAGFFTVLFAGVKEREKAAQAIEHLVYHDPLTGLFNRTFCRQLLASNVDQARAARRHVAVICIDLDGFKHINDTQGHPAGDILLTQVARRLKSAVREGDLVARVGGDEFIIVQEGGFQPADAAALADRVITMLAEPFLVLGKTASISAGTGVALFPDHGTDPDHLIVRADAALYQAKQAGKGVVHFFDEMIEAQMREREELRQNLVEALANDELKLAYQPIINVSDGSIVAMEALIRWDHPRFGAVDPALFIGLAEQRSCINEIGMWVLRRACTDALA